MLGDLNGWVGDRMRVDLGFQEKTVNEEDLLISALKEGCAWVTHTWGTRVFISTQGWLGTKTEWRYKI